MFFSFILINSVLRQEFLYSTKYYTMHLQSLMSHWPCYLITMVSQSLIN